MDVPPAADRRHASAWLTALAVVCALAGAAGMVVVFTYPRVDRGGVGCGLAFAVGLSVGVFLVATVVIAIARIVRRPAIGPGAEPAAPVPTSSGGPSRAQAVTIAASGILLLGSSCGAVMSSLGNTGPAGWIADAMGPALVAGWIILIIGQILLAKVAFRR